MSDVGSLPVNPSSWPMVTIVMPVRNEKPYISRSLGAVLVQDYPSSRMEVIVADGMSVDGTREVVRAVAERDPRVRLVDNRGRIAPKALNAALSVARGEIVVRVDGHCEIAPDYVSRCVAHLTTGLADGVGGPLETVGETPIAQVIAVALSSAFGVGGAAFRTRKKWTGHVDTVAFPAYTRAAIELAGPYDEELVRNQDDEYNYRLRSFGARILLAEDVHSRYYSRGSWKSLWRQYFQYGFWKVRVMQKHSGQMRLRQFIPPAFVALLLVTLAGAAVFHEARLLGGAILASYILCLAGATGLLASGRPAMLVLRLPLAFAILHVSYGLGFLAGLVRFAGRWRDHGTSGEFRPVGSESR